MQKNNLLMVLYKVIHMILKEVTNLFNIVNPSEDYTKISMCELGNQRWICRKHSAKRHFKDMGIKEHVSIDLNGKNESLKLDLQLPLPYHNYFDITTDFGTIEHVKSQYEVFNNVCNITKINGYIIHSLPLYGDWEKHCNWYYEPIFFKELARLNRYKMLLNEIRYIKLKRVIKQQGSICVIYKKKKEGFITREQFNAIPGLHYLETTRTY